MEDYMYVKLCDVFIMPAQENDSRAQASTVTDDWICKPNLVKFLGMV